MSSGMVSRDSRELSGSRTARTCGDVDLSRAVSCVSVGSNGVPALFEASGLRGSGDDPLSHRRRLDRSVSSSADEESLISLVKESSEEFSID